MLRTLVHLNVTEQSSAQLACMFSKYRAHLSCHICHSLSFTFFSLFLQNSALIARAERLSHRSRLLGLLHFSQPSALAMLFLQARTGRSHPFHGNGMRGRRNGGQVLQPLEWHLVALIIADRLHHLVRPPTSLASPQAL